MQCSHKNLHECNEWRLDLKQKETYGVFLVSLFCNVLLSNFYAFFKYKRWNYIQFKYCIKTSYGKHIELWTWMFKCYIMFHIIIAAGWKYLLFITSKNVFHLIIIAKLISIWLCSFPLLVEHDLHVWPFALKGYNYFGWSIIKIKAYDRRSDEMFLDLPIL